MRVAAVIPCYNHARYVGKAIESCLAQTRRPDRIIVIDDGSSDDSLAVCRGYETEHVEVLAQENRGAHATINRLVSLASKDCDIISILNSDDHYAPSRFAGCLPLLEAQPDKSVISTGLRVIDGNDAELDPAEPRARWFRAVWSWRDKPDADLCEWLGMANFPATTSNIIARASFLLRFPFRPYRFNHDLYFLAQSVLRGTMLLHPAPLVNYRVHATNTINTSPAPLMREMLRMHLDLWHDLASELSADPALRERFMRYARALWDSVSSFHAGLFHVVLAGLLEGSSEEQRAAAAAAVPDAWAEMNTYPNKALVNAWDGTTPLGVESGLADKYEALRAENKTLKTNAKAWQETATLWSRVAHSRPLAWRRALGLWRPPQAKGSAETQAETLRGLL